MEWSLLASLPTGEVRLVLSIARRRRFARGEVVFHQQDPADSLHLIVSGRFAFSVTTPRAEAIIVAIRGPGEHFGEMALVGAGEPRAATVTALEPSETFAILGIDFQRLRADHPRMNQVLIDSLVDEVRILDRRLLDAVYLPVGKRVLRRLAELAEIYGDTEIPLTQDQIADFVGANRGTVNRILREEEERGTLELRRGRTVIRDQDALRRRAGI